MIFKLSSKKYNNKTMRMDKGATNNFKEKPSNSFLSSNTQLMHPSNITLIHLRFSYSNPKQRLKFQSIGSKHSSFSIPSSHPQRKFHSSTFYPLRQKVEPQSARPMNYSQSTELQYIGAAFPKRKQKTGEQQYLKIVLKIAGELSQRQQRANMKHQLPDLGSPQRNCRFQARTRFNWDKTRYCVNRDREMGLFRSSFAQHNDDSTH